MPNVSTSSRGLPLTRGPGATPGYGREDDCEVRSVGIAVSAAALIALGGTAVPAHAYSTAKWGCPSGAVCMYTKGGWDRD